MKIYDRSEFWVIVAVIVGFLLSVLWEIFKNKYSLCKKESAIRSELATNLGLLPQKIDILQQARNSFIDKKSYQHHLFTLKHIYTIRISGRLHLNYLRTRERILTSYMKGSELLITS